jgi:hypothetical protein
MNRRMMEEGTDEFSERLNMPAKEARQVMPFVTHLVRQGLDPYSIVEKTLKEFCITDPFKIAFVGYVYAIVVTIDLGYIPKPSPAEIRRYLYES